MQPIETVLATLTFANLRSGDPRLTFVNLLTAASVSGKLIGLSHRQIRQKLLEVEMAAGVIHKTVMEISDAGSRDAERSRGSADGNGSAGEEGS